MSICKLAVAKCLTNVSIMGTDAAPNTGKPHLFDVGICDPLSRQQSLRSDHDTSCFVEVCAGENQLMGPFSRLLLSEVCEESDSEQYDAGRKRL